MARPLTPTNGFERSPKRFRADDDLRDWLMPEFLDGDSHGINDTQPCSSFDQSSGNIQANAGIHTQWLQENSNINASCGSLPASTVDFRNSTPITEHISGQQEDNLHPVFPETPHENFSTVLDLTPEEAQEDQVVCFGMYSGVMASYEQRGQDKLLFPFDVNLDSASRFSSTIYKSFRGHIESEHWHVLEALLDESSLKLHGNCVIDQPRVAEKKGRVSHRFPCSVTVSIYGPLGLFNEIGDWFQENEIYLQDPDTCCLDVKYCNPHRMSSNDFCLCPMVSEVVSKSKVFMPKELQHLPDFLDILSSQVDLEEAPQPSAISAVLKRHQRQALTFMLNREEGWGFNQEYPDIWETVDYSRGRMFHNTISNLYQPQEPPQFSGGIIADPMGLGKTLTMIALVATDMDTEKKIGIDSEDDMRNRQVVPATLVIIPPPILDTWEHQLGEHVVRGALTYRRHHGKNKIYDVEELDTVNLVLTTYHTVAAEWKSNQGARKSPLFSVRWRRILLDEAHFVRNGSSRIARAVCELEGLSRWAVTGTPIQNRLGDLASLLKFIRAHPYTDPKKFETDISRLWKAGEVEEAVKRLKRLSACLLLRRAKATINLPPRCDMVYEVEFMPEERAAYERIRQQTIARIDEVLGEETGAPSSRGYVNVLQQIESLRLFSNLGLFYDLRHERTSQQTHEAADEWSEIAQRTFDSQRGLSSISCVQCKMVLGPTETLDDDGALNTAAAQYTSCLKFICGDCVERLAGYNQVLPCGHMPPACQMAPVSTSGIPLEEVDHFSPANIRMASFAPPSKVKALIKDIKGVGPDVKCVVFSTWRLTLDLIKAGLDYERIQSIRFDGKVPQKDRQSVIDRFETDPDIRVMLLTLSCGAVGLTLTTASRAYLMEPHWNPTLEEQALARIHRLGQTREVTTVRLRIKESFEEQVVKVQESKRQLAGVLLSPHDNGYTDSNSGALEIAIVALSSDTRTKLGV